MKVKIIKINSHLKGHQLRQSLPVALCQNTSEGSCFLGSSFEVSSIQPGTSLENPPCSFAQSGTSSVQPVSGRYVGLLNTGKTNMLEGLAEISPALNK